MDNKIEAIKEAINFIRHNWIGKSGIWRGDVIDFVGATLKADVSYADVRHLISAKNKGEPTPVEGLGGSIKDNSLFEVWVTK